MTPRTPQELLALVEAGTGGEWRVGFSSIVGTGGPVAVVPDRDDETLIVALHNLSRKLAALWAAAEGVSLALKTTGGPDSCAPGCTAGGPGHFSIDCTEDALDRALAALGGAR